MSYDEIQSLQSIKRGLVVRGFDSLHEVLDSNLITANVLKKKKKYNLYNKVLCIYCNVKKIIIRIILKKRII